MLRKFYANQKKAKAFYSTKFKDHTTWRKQNRDSVKTAIQAEAHMFAKTRKKGKPITHIVGEAVAYMM